MNSILRAINNVQELELVEQTELSKLYVTPRYTILVAPCIQEIKVIDKVTIDVYIFNLECELIYKQCLEREVIL